MRLRTLAVLLAVTLSTIGLSAYSAIARHTGVVANQQSAASHSDPISRTWDVSFFVNGSPHPATFDLKLKGTKVTGTAVSDHTGPGTIRDGNWLDGKLSFTLDFKTHESIAVKGALKDGKLGGEFTTEGFTSTWEASKK